MHRGWMNHPAFRNNDDRVAWVWIIEHAVFRETTISIKNKPVKLKKGELSYSQRYLSEAWGIGRQQVRGLINHFIEWDLISLVKNPASNPVNNHGQMVLKVNKYAEKQELNLVHQTSDQPSKQPDPNPNKNTLKYINKEIEPAWEGSIISLQPEHYDRLFNIYPDTHEGFMEFLDGLDRWFLRTPSASFNWPATLEKKVKEAGFKTA